MSSYYCSVNSDWRPCPCIHGTCRELGYEPSPDAQQQEGDQPLPTINDSQFIQDLVINDIVERKQVGIKRYGTALQAHNGRDALLDAYEEAIDLCMYLKQLLVERNES